jgi:MFS family permease
MARISIFFSAASLSGAFSGLLAFGIVNLDGKGGKPGWAWIFILEGLFTCLFGAASFFLLPRSPAHMKFLSEAERDYVLVALKDGGALDHHEEADKFTWGEVKAAFALPHVWILAVVLFMSGECHHFWCSTALTDAQL